jgi:hypothetical protein
MPKTTIRTAHLRKTLLERRREIEAEVQHNVRYGRTNHAAEGRDDMEDFEADTQGDIAFMLLHWRSSTRGSSLLPSAASRVRKPLKWRRARRGG